MVKIGRVEICLQSLRTRAEFPGTFFFEGLYSGTFWMARGFIFKTNILTLNFLTHFFLIF